MANLLQKASIVLTPTAYDNGKVLCAKPSEPPYGDFDFSRNSAATRVNAQGLVENVQILSSNLVQNGDFSEEGAEEVSNGSFSQEGVEEITNGSFDTDTKWTKGTGWSISGGSANCDGTQSGNSDLRQQNGVLGASIDFVVGKTYKVNFDIVVTSGAITYIELASGFDNTDITTSGNHTTYITAVSTNDRFTIAANPDFNGSIDNVSVREVGQNWDLGTGWSIGEDKAISDGTSGNLYQSGIIVTGKQYKIQATISDYVSGNVEVSAGAVPRGAMSANGTYTFYQTASSTSNFFVVSKSFNGSITNISVKEVGQNWTLGTDVVIGNSVVKMNNSAALQGATQTNVITSGNLCKVSFEVKNYVNGIVNLRHPLSEDVSANGVYTFVGNANDTKVFIRGADTTNNFEVTNISVIEITDDTNLPRINYEGFSYQDALGSELVTNGSFDNGSTGWFNPDGAATFSNNSVTISGGSGNRRINQSNVTSPITSEFKLQYEITEKVGTSDLKVYTTNSGSAAYTIVPSTIGVHTLYFTSNLTTFYFNFNNSSGSITIDNVSVKEYLGQEVVPDSGCGSWLWEPQSTNLITYSEDFSQWTANGGASVQSGFLAPDGTNNAYKVSGTGSSSLIFSSVTNTTDTRTIYAKTVSGTGDVYLCGNLNDADALFTITDQWQRFELNGFTGGGATTFSAVDFRGSSTLTEVVIWGAQNEALSYATSYIPTSGSSVTRNQDVCTNGGSLASINSTEGVLYAEIAGLDSQINDTFSISLSDGSSANRLFLSINSLTNVYRGYAASSLGSSNINFTGTDTSSMSKIAVRYSPTDFSLWVNGIKRGAVTYNGMVNAFSKLNFDRNGNGELPFFGKTKALAVWKEALSDQELADLTYPTPTDPTFALDFDTIATDFTFARGSEATYVDAQGLIQSTNEIGPELITNGDFATDSDWAKQEGWTISGGTANANMILGGNGNIYQSALVVGKTYELTFTVSNYVQGYIRNVSQTGSIPLYQSNGTFTETFVANNSNLFMNANASASTQLSIDNVSVKEYITATNTPRLDYSTGAEAFLLEPQGTNLITQSELFSDASWLHNSDITTTNSLELAPNGNLDAYLIEYDGGGYSFIRLALATPSTAITLSVFAKKGNWRYLGFRNFQSSGDNHTVFDFDTETFPNIEGSQTASFEVFPNGWYRIKVNQPSPASNPYVGFALTNSIGGELNPTGGQVANVHLFGAQLEEQSYATSYIPTSGTTVTRNQETCINATPEINSEEGVLYAEIAALANQVTSNHISLSDGTYNNRISLMYSVGTNVIRAFLRVGGASQADLGFTGVNIKDFHKVAFKYKENDFALWIDGVEVGTDTNGSTLPSGTLTKLAFSEISTTGGLFRGNTKDLQVYTKALSDAELIKLTT